ncbi:Helix-turn-helix [Eubacterium aggregans]|uniref:Helix-turn-helix n=1 Tax=Eubacterium aggregans TaxID=81409 RepID=A0A1H3YV15_9FIRM|nr:XRE family transcriptional regulator [Eubacterium aggregans]SEA14938.1 Helix-turn-helix [Eubacterium aggregans]
MGIEKINEYKKALHLTTEELSIKSGVPMGTLNKILNGTTKDPKLETLKSLARVLRCTLDDFDDSDSVDVFSIEERKHILKYRDLDPYGQDLVTTVLNKEHERCTSQPESDRVNESELPLYLLPTSAGTGVFLDSDDYELRTFKNAPHDANFAVQVSGDSMEPEYESGDIVYVKQQQDLRDGQIGIFIFNGEGFIKEMDRQGHSLISLNQKYSPIVVTASDDLRIVGKVLGKA